MKIFYYLENLENLENLFIIYLFIKINLNWRVSYIKEINAKLKSEKKIEYAWK